MLFMNSGISFLMGICSIIFGVTIKVRGQQTFSVKGQVTNILGYEGLQPLSQVLNSDFVM